MKMISEGDFQIEKLSFSQESAKSEIASTGAP